MASALFEKGREGFLDGTIAWNTNTVKVMLLDMSVNSTAIKAVTLSNIFEPRNQSQLDA